MCVYKNDDADHFVIAVNSLYDQTTPPKEVIVVGDGPLSDELNQAITKLKKKHSNLTFYQLKKNQGVGAASNYGISKAKCDLIAKMDADDISVPERLEKQVAEFQKDQNLDILGGQLEEFIDNDPTKVVSRREVPLGGEELAKFARRRSPMNNPTIMFRKRSVEDVGGYPELNRAEDYYLFARMLAANKKLRNLPDVLIKYRLGADNTQRRKSWKHTKEMIYARYEVYKLGVARFPDFLYMATAFMFLFIMPAPLAEKIYKRKLRR